MEAVQWITSGKNAMILRVTSYRNQSPQGVLRAAQAKGDIPFYSTVQLLKTMEQLMDQNRCPQRNEERRTFAVHPDAPSAAPLPDSTRPLATFQVHVLFRQNACWQGSLIWMEKKMDAQFRSVLELLRLMDSALCTCAEEDASEPLKTS